MFNPDRLASYDLETHLFSAGRLAPKIVCGSLWTAAGGRLFAGPREAVHVAENTICNPDQILVGANLPYDLAVLAAEDEELLPLIFQLLNSNRGYDVLIAESLNAIFGGHLGLTPEFGPLYKPGTREVTTRYSLELSTWLTLGRADAKANDVFRTSYGLLDGLPLERYPEVAKSYMLDDTRNGYEIARAQIIGRPAKHSFVEAAREPGGPVVEECEHCKLKYTALYQIDEVCSKAPLRTHKNLGNMKAQLQAAFALHLGACWSLRTDPERVAKLRAVAEAKHDVMVERFQKKGWIRDDGSEDQAAVKKAIATAYGAAKPCEKCSGTGRIKKMVVEPCRGVKLKGRYQGCLGVNCLTCAGAGQLVKEKGDKTCKNIFDEDKNLIEEGCDGTGFDLKECPVPRTDTRGVSMDRDAKMESGDEDLADYGGDEFEKTLSTYVPYLETGICGPLFYQPNILLLTGRTSIEKSPLHQMPRNGGERSCIRARGAWCGSPIEYVLGSTDYEAGELCTLAQFTYWLFGYSQMRDAINTSGKPGILHSDLAAEVLGIALEEFLTRLKAKDKQSVDFRQMCKPINFGVPGGMGATKLVLTSRKKNAGFTVCEGGPATNEKGLPGYWGVRFCVLTGGHRLCGEKKTTQWKKIECPPTCVACLEVVDKMLRPAYFRRYPEIVDYHKWVKKQIDKRIPAPTAIWSEEEQAPVIIRERGCTEFSAYANNGFQSLLSDIGKDAVYRTTEECYTGRKRDGSPSPLAGCRLPLYLHDEPLSELIRDTAHLSGPRIAENMVESGKRMAPDVVWKAETALMEFWYKAAEPVYMADGKLTIWQPEVKAA